jgi:starvation-inducible DNA-binding protein
MLENQYNELFLAVDSLAERIRALGDYAPGSFEEFSKLTTIKDSVKHTKAQKMLEELLEGHESLSKDCRKLLELAAKMGDEGTANLLTERMEKHEKDSWMLRSSLIKE